MAAAAAHANGGDGAARGSGGARVQKGCALESVFQGTLCPALALTLTLTPSPSPHTHTHTPRIPALSDPHPI